MNFSSSIISELYREHLFNFLKDSVIPIYEDFLKNQLRTIRLNQNQQNAIVMYVKIVMEANLIMAEEFDMNDAHQVFDHMRKNLIAF